MKLKLFWRKDCRKCQPAKIVCKDLEGNGFEVEYYDVDTVDGMAEAAFYEVISTPTTIVVDERGNEIASWRGEVPDTRAIIGLQAKG
ncbi:MAG: thioredoxin family protein [Thermoproteota archaeon]